MKEFLATCKKCGCSITVLAPNLEAVKRDWVCACGSDEFDVEEVRKEEGEKEKKLTLELTEEEATYLLNILKRKELASEYVSKSEYFDEFARERASKSMKLARSILSKIKG